MVMPAWSGLGEKSSVRLNGCGSPLTSSLFSPQAASPRARESNAASSPRRSFIPCFLPPSDDTTLCEGEEAEESDRHRREDGDRCEEPRRLQAGTRVVAADAE